MSFAQPVYLPGGKALIVDGMFNKAAAACCCGVRGCPDEVMETTLTVVVTGYGVDGLPDPLTLSVPINFGGSTNWSLSGAYSFTLGCIDGEWLAAFGTSGIAGSGWNADAFAADGPPGTKSWVQTSGPPGRTLTVSYP